MSDTTPVSLASLVQPSRTITFDVPSFEGFKMDLCFLTREEFVKLRNKCITTGFDKKTRQATEEFDQDLFIKHYCQATIKNWTGLKYSYLEELLLADLSDLDPDDCLPFNIDNAITLLKQSQFIDDWVTETAGDLANFTMSKSKNSDA